MQVALVCPTGDTENNDTLSCELLFECDLTCSASAELRSEQWVALCFQRMPSQSIGSRANRAPQIFHHQLRFVQLGRS
jgi:hypothetical protein